MPESANYSVTSSPSNSSQGGRTRRQTPYLVVMKKLARYMLCPYHRLIYLTNSVGKQSLLEVIAKRKAIEEGTADPGWSLVDGMVVHNGRLFMPSSATAWHQVLAHAHGVGHEGVQKTLQRLRTSFSTPGDNKLVREFIHGCSVCQRNKTEHLHLAGLLQRLAVPSSVCVRGDGLLYNWMHLLIGEGLHL
jgi:hypothetical protein